MNILRVLLSLAAQFDWNTQQFDVKNVFLHDDLEEVFMESPPIFLWKNRTRCVVRESTI